MSKLDNAKKYNHNQSEAMANFPDLVIHEILRRLPTKAVVHISLLCKQWEGILSSAPILDFDEGGDGKYGDNNLEKHEKFINILNRYLVLSDQHPQIELDKFRLRMTSYKKDNDDITVNKLLFLSFEKSVKELDISLRVNQLDWDQDPVKCYSFSPKTFTNASSITTLNLEYVRINNFHDGRGPSGVKLLPSLKSMSLKNVFVDGINRYALFYVIWECPGIEYLSLVSCSFRYSEIHFISSTLKLFKAKHCKARRIDLREAPNLECVTIVSSKLTDLFLRKCFNLKHVDIRAEDMKFFLLDEESRNVQGRIYAPKLDYFSFQGYMNSKISLKASRQIQAHIILKDKELSTLNQPWKHFLKLKDFLAKFYMVQDMIFYVPNLKLVMFSKIFRNTFSSPILPNVMDMDFLMDKDTPPAETDMKELNECLRWMAPYASRGRILLLTDPLGHVSTRDVTRKDVDIIISKFRGIKIPTMTRMHSRARWL